QSVALTRAVAGQGAAGLVNAVLPRVGERSRSEWEEAAVPAEPVARRPAALRSHPAWVAKGLRQALVGHGAATKEDSDEVRDQLLLAHAGPAPGALVGRPGLADVEELVAAGATAGRWSPVAAELPGGDPGAIDAVREGRAAAQ